MEDEPGTALAPRAGRGLQLTNIRRDVDEDAARGRLCLRREAREAAGIRIDDPALVLMHPALGAACAPVIERAKNHFRAADAIMDRSPRGVIRTPRIRAEAYNRILTRLAERGLPPPRVPCRRARARRWWP